MTYIPLGLKQTASIFLLLGMGNIGPPPPGGTGQTSALWLTIKRGIRTKGQRTSWDDDNTA